VLEKNNEVQDKWRQEKVKGSQSAPREAVTIWLHHHTRPCQRQIAPCEILSIAKKGKQLHMAYMAYMAYG
jgi:hypothetical protein